MVWGNESLHDWLMIDCVQFVSAHCFTANMIVMFGVVVLFV